MSGGLVGRARLGVALGVLALVGCVPELRLEDRGFVEHALGDDVRVQQRWRHDEYGVNGADYLLWRRQGQDWVPLVGDWQPGQSYSAPTLEPPCQRLDARRLLLTDGDASWIFDLERGTRSGPHPWAMLLPVAAVEGRPERWFAFASWKDGVTPLSGVAADSTDAWIEARRRLRLMNERAHDAVVEAERKEAQAALDAMIASRCASYGETREAVLELLRSGGLRVGSHSLQAPCPRCAGAGQVQDQRSTTSWTDDEGYMTIYRWSVTVDCEHCRGTGWY